MAGRSSAIGRVIAYFKETSIEEADAAFAAVSKVMASRTTSTQPKLPFKARKPRTNARPVDVEPEEKRESLGNA